MHAARAFRSLPVDSAKARKVRAVSFFTSSIVGASKALAIGPAPQAGPQLLLRIRVIIPFNPRDDTILDMYPEWTPPTAVNGRGAPHDRFTAHDLFFRTHRALLLFSVSYSR